MHIISYLWAGPGWIYKLLHKMTFTKYRFALDQNIPKLNVKTKFTS